AAGNGAAPTIRQSPAAAAERLRLAAASSRSRRLRSATGRNCEPNSVSDTRRVVRSNRRTPSWVSSSRTRTLIPDWVMNRCSAAREKLWCLAVSTKAFNCREVIFILDGDEWINPTPRRRGRGSYPAFAATQYAKSVDRLHRHAEQVPGAALGLD